MHIKTFSAPTNSQAMEMVRETMGDDAIIISAGKSEDGSAVKIVAAIESDIDLDIDDAIEEEPEHPNALNTEETVRQALSFHGVPPRLSTNLARYAAQSDAPNPTLALAAAIDTTFAFSPLDATSSAKPVMLVGPPGSGKTIVAAKLCTQARLANREIIAITCDTQRAGGVEQLKAFTNILGIDLITVDKPETLKDHIRLDASEKLQIIDTASTNPYDEADMDGLNRKIKACGAEPVLVLAAGCDPMEIADMTRFYGDIGVTRFIVTQMDIARRAGGILAAANSVPLAFCDVSVSSVVSDNLKSLSPVSLARLIMPHTDDDTANQQTTEAAQ